MNSTLRPGLAPFYRSLTLLAWLALLSCSAFAQAGGTPLKWSSVVATASASSGSTAQVNATVADGNGTVYLVGSFRGTIKLGSTELTSSGGLDAFVAKWNSQTSTFVWALRAGGADNDGAGSLAFSGTNLYLSGSFGASGASFGSLAVTSAGASDAYVAKVVDAGTSASFAWVQRLGDSGADNSSGLAVVGTSVYVAGAFSSPSLTLGPTTLTNAGNRDGFIAKLTDAGTSASVAWAHQLAGTGFDYFNALAANQNGVYAAGGFRNTATVADTSLTSTGSSADILVVKFNDAGKRIWAQRIGNEATEDVYDIRLYDQNVYLAGSFYGNSQLGSTVLTNTDNTGITSDAYVAKLTDAGRKSSVAWALAGGGPARDIAFRVAAVGNELVVAGEFGGPTAQFGTTLTNAGRTDAFVAGLRDNGTSALFTWNQSGGGAGTDGAYALCYDGGRVVVGGTATPPATFGSLSVGSGTDRVGFLGVIPGVVTATTPATAWAGLQLYPNPAHAGVTLQLPSVGGQKPVALTLVNALGQVVTTRQVLPAAGRPLTLDLTGYRPGLYQLHLQAGNQRTARPLVIE